MNKTTKKTTEKPEVKRNNKGSLVQKKERLKNKAVPAVDNILHLQRTIGNQAVQKLFKSGTLQAKLKIGKPGDKYEQEADRVANIVMRMPEPKESPVTGHESLDKKEDENVQAKENNSNKAVETPDIESSINSLRGGGQPLPESMRNYFESRFGYDFSGVRVHADSKASGAAKAINAKAFTTGTNIVFNTGQYSPETGSGKRLLAHELTHVVQQTGIDKELLKDNNLQRMQIQLSPAIGKSERAVILKIRWSAKSYEDFKNSVQVKVREILRVPADWLPQLTQQSNLDRVYDALNEEESLRPEGEIVEIKVSFKAEESLGESQLYFNVAAGSAKGTGHKEAESTAITKKISEEHVEIAQIYFGFGSTIIDYKDLKIIERVTEKLKKIFKNMKSINILVHGFASVEGSQRYNQILSERRAQTVAKLLSDGLKHISAKLTIIWSGFGAKGTENDIEDVRALNRKVEISYIKKPQRPEWLSESPPPWTSDELSRLQKEDPEIQSLKRAGDEEGIKEIYQSYYFPAEQIINNWNTRFGKWDPEGKEDYWAKWFCDQMHEGECIWENPYLIPLDWELKKKLFEDFKQELIDKGFPFGLGTAGTHSGSGSKGSLYLYHWCLREKESRNPTNLSFNPNYREFILFQITDKTIKNLKTINVPANILQQLEIVQMLGIIKGEQYFLNTIKRFIKNEDEYENYKRIIREQAILSEPVEPTTEAYRRDKEIPLSLGSGGMSNEELEDNIKKYKEEIQ